MLVNFRADSFLFNFVDAKCICGLSCWLAFGCFVTDARWKSVRQMSINLGTPWTITYRQASSILMDDVNSLAVAWDGVDKLADLHISGVSVLSARAAERTGEGIFSKYVTLPDSDLFQLLAFETLGPVSSSCLQFLSELGLQLILLRKFFHFSTSLTVHY